MATTRSRSRQRSAEIKRFSLSLSIISRMASTWPCGRDFCVVNRSCGETRGSSRSTRRKVSILSGGQSERLATVRLRVFWPSRQASRRRTAGGELRLGTTSMYMGALDHNNYTLSSITLINYMGAYWRSRDGTMHTFPTVYLRIQPLLLLELRAKGQRLGIKRRGWDAGTLQNHSPAAFKQSLREIRLNGSSQSQRQRLTRTGIKTSLLGADTSRLGKSSRLHAPPKDQ